MAVGDRIIKLSVYRDGKLLKETSFDRSKILVGAYSRADLRLDEEGVERRHLELSVNADGQVSARNLVDPARTSHNGAPLAGESTLKTGDRIDVGPFRILVTLRDRSEEAGVAQFYEKQAEERRQGGVRALEVAMFWDEALFAVNHYTKLQGVSVGEAKGTEYFAPEERVGTRRYQLIVPLGGRFAVNFKSPEIEGDVLINDKIYSVAELKTAGVLTGEQLLLLDETTRCRLYFGDISFLISYATLPPKPKKAFFGRVSLHEHIYTSVSLIAHMLFLIILSLIPEEQLSAQADHQARRKQAIQVMAMQAEERREQEEEKKEEVVEEVVEDDETKADGEEEGNPEADEETPEEDPVKKPTVVRPDADRTKVDRETSRLTPERMREHNRRIALQSGVHRVMESRTDLIQDVMGGGAGLWGGRGRGLRTLMSRGGGPGMASGAYFTGGGGLDPFGGATAGPGGGGFMGTALAATVGPGGGGGAEEAIAGLGKGDGDGRPDGRARFDDRPLRARVVSGSARVTGGLDRDTIQRYIRKKIPQVRLCYQNELQRDRSLKGTITVAFVIDPEGRVVRPSIAGSTMGNSTVESCILQRVALWRFPSSRTSAVARVSYPFIFKAQTR